MSCGRDGCGCQAGEGQGRQHRCNHDLDGAHSPCGGGFGRTHDQLRLDELPVSPPADKAENAGVK
jgi:hypothetical protein